jgi:hypothetical protein
MSRFTKFKTITLKELEDMVKEKPRMKWGNWSYDPETFYLTYKHFYPVNLTTKNSNSALLDLIFQLNTKDNGNWDSDCVSDLVKAINDIFYPQANCCSGGENKKFNAKKLCKKYNKKLFQNGQVW